MEVNDESLALLRGADSGRRDRLQALPAFADRALARLLRERAPAVIDDVLQRPDWHGSPIDLGEFFVVTKNGRKACCLLRTHQFGWELRLFVGTRQELVFTQVCRTQEDVLSTGENWKAAMLEKGWA